MACQAGTNPAVININNNVTLHVFCVAHAKNLQRVTLSFATDMSNPIGVFIGNGEGVAMPLDTGNQVLSIPTGSNNGLFAQFTYSVDGVTFQNATVCAPLTTSAPGLTVTTVTSEDETDDDDNDSYLTVVQLSSR